MDNLLHHFPLCVSAPFLRAHLAPAGCLQHTRVCLVHFDIVILQPALFFLSKGSASAIWQVPVPSPYYRTFFKIFWDKPQNIYCVLKVKKVR